MRINERKTFMKIYRLSQSSGAGLNSFYDSHSSILPKSPPFAEAPSTCHQNEITEMSLKYRAYLAISMLRDVRLGFKYTLSIFNNTISLLSHIGPQQFLESLRKLTEMSEEEESKGGGKINKIQWMMLSVQCLFLRLKKINKVNIRVIDSDHLASPSSLHIARWRILSGANSEWESVKKH